MSDHRVVSRTAVVLTIAVLLPLAYRADVAGGLEPAAVMTDLMVSVLLTVFALTGRSAVRVLAWGAVAATWLAGSAWPDAVALHRGAFVLLVVLLTRSESPRRLGAVLLSCGSAALLAVPAVGPGAAAALLFVAGVALVAESQPPHRAAAGSLLLLAAAELVVAAALRIDTVPGSLLPSFYALAFLTSATWTWVAVRNRERLVAGLAPDVADLEGRDVFVLLTGLVRTAVHDPTLVVEPAQTSVPPPNTREVVVQGRPWAWVHSSRGWLSDDIVWRSLHVALARVGDWERLLADEHARAADLATSRARLVNATDRERADVGAALRRDVLVPLGWAADLLRRDFPLIGGELRGAVDDVGSLVIGVSPVPLGGGALLPAVTGLAERCPMPVEVTATGEVMAEAAVETALYAVCAEALTNALKHACASRVDITLDAGDDALRLTVTDDGIGIGAGLAATAGIAGLADRVGAVGGSLSVEDAATGGTTVVAVVPSSALLGSGRP